MKHLFFILALLVINSQWNYGQQTHSTQTIRGRVYDKVMKSPIPGINVVVLGSQPLIGTATDADGNFRLDNIQTGRVSLRFSGVGYHEVVLQNLTLQIGKELILNVPMEEAIITTEEVTIVAQIDKTSSTNKMAMLSARSFTVEETERYAGSRNDVARMAANYAGVLGVDDARNDIIIRGNSPIGLLWRLEGVEIPNPNHWGMSGTTGGPVCMLNNNLLENSDFFTGAFPAEYGNALSGIFDLRMRSGNNQKYEFLGQIGFNGAEAGAEGPLKFAKEASFLFNYRYSTMAVFDALGMDFGTVGVPYYQDLSFKFNFPKTSLGEISFFGLGGKNYIEIWESRMDTANSSVNYYGPGGIDVTSGTHLGVVGISNLFRFNPTLFSNFTLSVTSQGEFNDVDTLTPVTIDKVHVFGSQRYDHRVAASFNITKKFSSRNYLKTGVQWKTIIGKTSDSVLSHGRFTPVSNFNGSTSLLQAFFQHQIMFSERLNFTYGLHSLYFRLNQQFSLEPRFGLKYYFAQNQSVSVGYGLHTQAQPILFYFYTDSLGNRNNPNLELTKSHHFVAAYDLKINDFTRLKIEPYYQHIFNAPVDATDSSSFSLLNVGASFFDFAPEKWINSGKGRNYGIELTLERFLNKGFYFLFTASLFDSKYRGSDGKEHNTAFNNRFIFNGLVGKEFELSAEGKRKTLSVNLKSTYAGGKPSTPYTIRFLTGTDRYERVYDYNRAFSVRLKDYFKTDFKIGFRMEGKRVSQEWALEITNLFNNKNIQQDRFNPVTGKVEDVYQTPFMAIPQWRILF